MMETMKRYLLTFGVIAASILALSSCNREENFTKEPEKNKVTFTFTAEKAGENTKTQVIEGAKASYLWTVEDQANFKLYLIGKDGSGNETKTAVPNTDITFNFSQDYRTLTITAAVEEAESYTFRAIVAGAFSSGHNPQVKPVQSPATDNYDPSADLLVSEDLTTTSPSNLALSFQRKAVINKMTLKNITADEKVKNVVITSTKNLTGTFSSNDFSNGDKAIRLNYASQPVVASNGEFSVYFAAIPMTGHTLTVTLTTDQHKYTKTFGGSIAFNQGEFTRFSVGLPAGADIDDVEGQYYIASMPGAWVLMDGECSSTTGIGYYPKVETSVTATAAEVTGADFLTVPNFQNYFWDIEATTGGYTIRNTETGLYLACTDGNSNYADYKETVDADAIFDISVENKVATIASITYQEQGKVLRYNSQQPRFAFYGGTQNPVYLIPTYDDGLTGVTLSFSHDIINKTTSDYSSFTGLTVSADPNESSITSAITYGMTGDAIGTVNASTGAVALNGSAGTATVTAVFPGNATYREASASYMIVVSSASGPQYLLVSTVAEVTEGDYIITWNNTYYLPSGASSGTNPAVGTGITVSNNRITNTVTSDMVWHFSGDNTDGFTISDGSNILHSTNGAQGISINTTSTRKWKVSVDGTYGMLLRGDDGGSRNLAVYSNSSWRYYTAGSDYKGNLRLYKLEDNRTDPGMSWSANSASASIEDNNVVVFSVPTLTPGNATGITYSSSDTAVATIDASTGAITLVGGGTTTISAEFAGDSSYKPSIVSYTLTVTDNRTPSYDFETVAELNALVTSTPATYSGYLTSAVVSFTPSADTRVAIVKDATGSVMFYKTSQGLKQGQTYTGEIEVTAVLYTTTSSGNSYSLYSEVTDWDVAFTGTETTVAPQTVTLSTLVGNYSTWQNAYVQIAGLTVSSISGQNINVTDGTNTYVVFDNPGTATCVVGDIITVVGTVTKYRNTEEIKVWNAADITITYHQIASHTITFSQPATGGSFTVKVDGSNISSGASVQEGKTVTLTATAASGYNFSSWTVTGASLSANTASTSFTMATSDVTISASFSAAGGSSTTEEITSGTFSGDSNSISMTTTSGVTIAQLKNGGAAFGASYNTVSSLRVYRVHQMQFTGKTFTKIEMYYSGSYSGANWSIQNGGGTVTIDTTNKKVVWENTGGASKVTLQNSTSNGTNTQLRTTKFVVTYN